MRINIKTIRESIGFRCTAIHDIDVSIEDLINWQSMFFFSRILKIWMMF